MRIKIFEDFFAKTLALLIIIELLSLLSYLLPDLGRIVFFIIIALAVVATICKLEYGLYLLLAELFVGSHGYLFSLELGGITLSIRMALFLVIFAAWLVKQIMNYESGVIAKKKSLLPAYYSLLTYLALFLIITFGIINGLLNNNLANTFLDANAWLYFALLPVFLTTIKKENIQAVVQILAAATIWLSLKTIGTLYLFSHGLAWLGDPFYRWIRDTGVGEVTYISGTMFRVFFQSHIYCLIGFFIILSVLLAEFNFKDWKKNLPFAIYLYLTALAIIISLSRSFWVGGLAAGFCLIAFAWWQLAYRFKKTFFLVLFLALILLSGFASFQLITGGFDGNLISNRFANLESEPAGMSRLNQLEPLLSNIGQKAWLGFGFGKELTYQSTDPRILKTYSGGIYTTYAFEWGYLDIALKLGVVGLGIYLVLIGLLFYLGIKNFKYQIANFKQISNAETLLSVGLLLGLTALCVTNIFSPYLNHPLGIGYIMLISTIYGKQ